MKVQQQCLWKWIEFMLMDVDGTIEKATKAKAKVSTQRVPRREKARENSRQKMENQIRKENQRVTQKARAVEDGSGKGKGVKPDVTCHKCGKYGHYARDCWSVCDRFKTMVSKVLRPAHQQLWLDLHRLHLRSCLFAPQSNRVARIQFSDQHGSDVQKHDELVFDVRTPISEAHAFDGCVNVVQFYVGDEPDAHFANNIGSHMIRTMLESVPDETEMHSILLDSGADASVFLASMAELGCPSHATASLLRDAQGNTIPLHGMRDVEIHLMDMQGHSVTIKESVALSDQISQPILCFGRLLESGWSIDGKQQTLTHGSVSIPIEMQHRSMTLRGWIRAVRVRGTCEFGTTLHQKCAC